MSDMSVDRPRWKVRVGGGHLELSKMIVAELEYMSLKTRDAQLPPDLFE